MTFLYCIGAYILAYAAHEASRPLTFVALILIAVGTGSIKPNVNTMGAAAMRTDNPQALATYFALFYSIINVGSVASTLLIPKIQAKTSFFVAYLFPASFLTIALIVFVAGYKLYVHNKPTQSLFVRIFQIVAAAASEKSALKREQVPTPTRALASKRSRRREINPDGTFAPISVTQQLVHH
eukprot:UN02735